MTTDTPKGEGLSADGVLKIADNLFGTALEVLDHQIERLKADEGIDALSASKAGQDLRKAIQIFFDERAKVEQLSNKASGGVTSDALDLDAARDEIGRRLACLRDAARAREIPQ